MDTEYKAIMQEYSRWLSHNINMKKDTDIPLIPCTVNIFKTLCFVKGIEYPMQLICPAMASLDIRTEYLLSFDHTSDLLVHALILNRYYQNKDRYYSVAMLPFEYSNPSDKSLHGMKIDKQTDLRVITAESGQNSFLINHITHLLRKDYKIKAVISLLESGYIPIGEMLESYGIEYRACIKLSDIIQQYNKQISPED